MKKFFYSVLAAATMLLATTSCSQEEEFVGGGSVDNGTTQKVTFTVQLPGDDAASRAIDEEGVEVGKGNMANKLIWALYEKDKKDANENPIRLDYGKGEKAEVVDGKQQFTATIDMVKGLTYQVLFFAYDSINCAFDLNSTNPEETDLTALTLKTDELVANQEGYDAFVKCHEHTASGSGIPTEVTLTRPFAQVNVATTVDDLDKAKKLQAVVTKSDMEIIDVPTQYNVLTGAATENANLTYAANNILTHYVAAGETTPEHLNEDITVEGNPYKYLTMAYVLAGETATSDASTHEVTFNFYRGEQGNDKMRFFSISNLPIQRNYRTNIIGDILTVDESFKIVIDERFDGNLNVNPEGQWPIDEAGLKYFLSKAENGDVIKLADDIALTEALTIPEGLALTLDLNGKTLSNENGYVLENQGNLTIDGDGTFEGLGIIRSTNGNLTVNSGNFYASSKWQDGIYQHTLKAENTKVVINGGNFDATINGQTNAVLNASTGATITINGGNFKNVDGALANFDPYLFTYENDGNVIINDGTFYGGWRFNGATSTTEIYGGNFTVGYDGQSFNANSTHVLTIYGGIFNPNTAYPNSSLAGKVEGNVAAGYHAIVNNGIYYVVSNEITNVVATAADLLAYSAKVLTGNNGTAEEATISILNDIDMDGAEFSAIIAQRGDKLTILGNGHTISNVKVVSGANDNTTGQASMFYAYPNSTLTVSNLTLKGIKVTADVNVTGYAAAVVGYCEGAAILNNVDVVNAEIIGVKSSGMLVGHLSGSLNATDCELSGTVTLAEYEAGGHYAGKYIGTLAGPAEMNNCSVDVTIDGNLNAANIGEVYGRKTAAGSSNIVSASDNESLSNAISAGATTVILGEGKYSIPSNSVASGKTLTIKGTEETIINAQSCYMDNAKLAFEGVTIKVGLGYAALGASDYAGIYSPNATFTKCHFDGGLRVGRSGAQFVECTFTLDVSDYVYTYGNSVSFSKCTFNSKGKALIVYSDGNGIGTAPNVSVENCVFNASQKGYAGAINNQECAAVEIDNYGCGVNLTLSGNIVDKNYFSGEWRIKKYYTDKNNVITVNGTEYTTLALDGKTMTINGTEVTVQ